MYTLDIIVVSTVCCYRDDTNNVTSEVKLLHTLVKPLSEYTATKGDHCYNSLAIHTYMYVRTASYLAKCFILFRSQIRLYFRGL